MTGPIEDPTSEDALDKPDEVLEGNVAQMLRRAPPTPVMAAASRARVLDALLAHQRAAAMGAAAAVERGDSGPLRRKRVPRESVVLGSIAVAAGFLGLCFSGNAYWGARVHENPGRGSKVVALLGGSKAVLDEGAKIEERGESAVRVAHGSVIFDVRQGHPLEVDAASTRVKSRDTAFLVNASDDTTQVAVARGKVAVESRGGHAVLAAGEQSSVRGDGAPATTRAPRLSHLFGFSRQAEAQPLAEAGAAPRAKGTLIARDPSWGMDRPLEIRDMTVDVYVEDGVARTTIDQTFFNTDPRPLEGVYQLPLPHGSAISRLGMYVDGKLMEAAVVDRDRARDIYEGIVYERRDPALLEWMSGNSYRMRIFPLPGRSEKRIFLSYTRAVEHLYDTERLVVPIPAVDALAGRFAVRVRVAGGAGSEVRSSSHDLHFTDEGGDRVGRFEARSYELGADVVVAMRSSKIEEDVARSFEEEGQRYLSVRVRPDLSTARAEAPVRGAERWVVLYDTSASRTVEALAAQRRFVRELVSRLERDDEIAVLAVDHTARSVGGPIHQVGALDAAALERDLQLAGEAAAGDMRLDVALQEASTLLVGPRSKTVLYVGDGTPTGGARGVRELATKLGEGVRFAGIAIGDSADMRVLDGLADARRGYSASFGLDDDLGHRALDVLSALRTPCLRALRATVVDADGAEVPGAVAHLASRRACDGEQIDVVARLAAGSSKAHAIRVDAPADGTREAFQRVVPLATPAGTASYLPRLWAGREVEAAIARGNADAERAGIVALATKHMLATPYTSLLVLENDAMYRQYGVEKRAATGFAVYPAPDTIPVVHEPLGRAPLGPGPMAFDAWSDLVHRQPTPVFVLPRETLMSLSRWRGPGPSSWRGVVPLSGKVSLRRQGARLSGASLVLGATASGDMPMSPAAVWTPRFDATGARRAWMEMEPARDHAESPGLIGWTTEAASDFVEAAMQNAEPSAFGSSFDHRFGDLTELVPALMERPVDQARQALEAAAGQQRSAPAPQALEALRRARAALPEAVYEVDGVRGAPRVSVGATIRIHLPQVDEIAAYDGTTIVSTYPSLDLAVTRQVGSAAPWLLAGELEFVAPSEAAVQGLDVSWTAEGTVRIRAPRLAEGAGDEDAVKLRDLELYFDESGRIRSVRWVHERGWRETTIDYEPGGDIVVHRPHGRPVRFRRVAAAASEAPGPTSTRVDVPVPAPARLDARLEAAERGSDGWLALQRNRLVACAALADDGCTTVTLRRILEARGKVTRGELVLASWTLSRAAAEDVKAALASVDPADPVRRAIAAARQADRKRMRSALAAVGASGALAAWLELRGILLDLEAGSTPPPATVARVEAFARDRRIRDELRFLATAVAAGRARASGDATLAVQLWSALADDPDLGFLADQRRALLEAPGNPAEAARLLVGAFQAALDRGLAATLDSELAQTVLVARGEVGFRTILAGWREHLLSRGSSAQIMAFLRTSVRGLVPADGSPGSFDDLRPLLERFERSGAATPEARIALANQLLAVDRASDAERLLGPLLDNSDRHPMAFDVASDVEERLGHLQLAASLLERAIRGSQALEIDLGLVRARYARLLLLQVVDTQAGNTEAAAGAEAVVRTARQWRREDADNPEIDVMVSDRLVSLGMHEEADRQLFSLLDRRPGDGEALGRVALVHEERGDFQAALSLWDAAAAAEATNPTWLLRKAHLLRARGGPGDEAEARALLAKIASGTWQDRFFQPVHEARQMLGLGLGLGDGGGAAP
jgi:ferric-dicitrate binding protein FerR (iron transport regulator)/tetratricopeptide (TPR) repeat protein